MSNFRLVVKFDNLFILLCITYLRYLDIIIVLSLIQVVYQKFKLRQQINIYSLT